MKTLRTFIIMVVLIIGGMAMTGCEDSNASDNLQTIPTDERPESRPGVTTLDSNEIKQVLDSINVLLSRIEASSKSQEANTNKLDEVTKEISDLRGLSNLYDFILLTIAAIALLVAMISLIRLSSIQKRANRHRKDIEEIKYRVYSFEQKTNAVPVRAKTTSSELSNNEYISLISRINKIEYQIDKIKPPIIPGPPLVGPPDVRHTSIDEQSGYFGLPTQMSLTKAYFKRLSDIRESDSRFTVEVRNDKAEFRPLEGTQYLNDLKSNDSIKTALDIQGCAPSEATQMRVILPGEAKKDGDRWIITKKTTIALYR